MTRKLFGTLIPNLARGVFSLLPAAGLSVAFAAEIGDTAAVSDAASSRPASIRVMDEPRLAQLLGPAAQVAIPAARGVVPAVRAAIPAARPVSAPQPSAARAVADSVRGGAVDARGAASGGGTGRSRSTAAHSYESNDAQGLRAKWNREVEYPLQLGAIDRQITVGKARLESYQRRLQRYSGYNAVAPPQSGAFRPSAVVPQAQGFYPGTFTTPVPVGGYEQRLAAASRYPATGSGQSGGSGPSRPSGDYPWTATTPTQAFSPPSTFSHVLGEVQRRYEESRLELDRLLKNREQLVANGPDSRMSAGRSPAAGDYERRLAAVDAERRQADSQYQSMDARVMQYDTFNRLTYLVSYADLREKLALGRLEAKLQLDGLDQERQLLQTHRSDWEQLQKASR
jgi:hypothetical protein